MPRNAAEVSAEPNEVEALRHAYSKIAHRQEGHERVIYAHRIGARK